MRPLGFYTGWMCIAYAPVRFLLDFLREQRSAGMRRRRSALRRPHAGAVGVLRAARARPLLPPHRAKPRAAVRAPELRRSPTADARGEPCDEEAQEEAATAPRRSADGARREGDKALAERRLERRPLSAWRRLRLAGSLARAWEPRAGRAADVVLLDELREHVEPLEAGQLAHLLARSCRIAVAVDAVEQEPDRVAGRLPCVHIPSPTGVQPSLSAAVVELLRDRRSRQAALRACSR